MDQVNQANQLNPQLLVIYSILYLRMLLHSLNLQQACFPVLTSVKQANKLLNLSNLPNNSLHKLSSLKSSQMPLELNHNQTSSVPNPRLMPLELNHSPSVNSQELSHHKETSWLSSLNHPQMSLTLDKQRLNLKQLPIPSHNPGLNQKNKNQKSLKNMFLEKESLVRMTHGQRELL